MEQANEHWVPAEGGLFDYTVSLKITHLCQAIDMYLTAEAATDWRVRQHSALSSVIHAFCAFETSVNELGHNMFFHVPSSIYVAPNQRNYLLAKMISGWDKAACLDKFNILIELRLGAKPESRTMARLRELNNLRNWVVHGFVFQSTSLLLPTGNGTFFEIDREDSTKWTLRFPNLKFNRLDKLDHLDAKKAIVTAIEGLLVTHRASDSSLILFSLNGTPTSSLVSRTANATEVFDDYLASKWAQHDVAKLKS